MKPLLFAASLALAASATAQPAAPIAGQWTNPKGSVVIDMAPCGPAWCGKVVQASAKARANAREGGTPNLIGKDLLNGFKADGKGGWSGRVFLPKRNMHATGTIRMAGPDAIVVRGCAVAGLICKDQRWRRVS